MRQKLDTVTLLGVDYQYDRLKTAFDICESYFDFAQKKLICNVGYDFITNTGIEVIHRNIDSKERYSEFMIKELDTFVDTEHVLIIQYDGFILNPDAWTDEFLEYDYIGAPWWFHHNYNVGNGGFSLRSKKLLSVLANDPNINEFHPEDSKICRYYGDYLRDRGIQFAPEDVAR